MGWAFEVAQSEVQWRDFVNVNVPSRSLKTGNVSTGKMSVRFSKNVHLSGVCVVVVRRSFR